MKRIKKQWESYRQCTHLPWYQRVLRFISGIMDSYHLHLSESLVTNILAIIVGILAGYGAVALRLMITWFTGFWQETGVPSLQNAIPSLGMWAFLPVPIIGMVIVALLVKYVADETGGSGIPEVMESVAMKGGRIRGRVALVKALASAVCIGFGGSAGREGPIVQIGASVGSVMATMLRMSRERRKWLVACGAGAGIAATFNTPIAGVIFAMEVILHGSSLRSFASIVLATVSGSVIARMYFGDVHAFGELTFSYESNLEILFYAILGAAAAGVSILYTKSVYWVADISDWFKNVHFVLKAAVAGLLIGIVICIWPEVTGVGYETISLAIDSELVWKSMLILMIVKIVATSLTIGSGGSGGIFAPALFIGAMLGGSLGYGFELLAPDLTAGAGPYVLVGMAAVFAASTHAPFTAIFALFEMTGDYNIILPLMLSVVIASLISNHFVNESIFTMKLLRRGVRLRWGTNIDILENLKVRDVMEVNVETVREDTSKEELYRLFTEKHYRGFPVLDENGRLVGVVTMNDYQAARKLPPSTPVSQFSTHHVLTALPSDDLSSAVKKMRVRDIGRICVVSEQDPTEMVGIITRSDILKAYDMALRRLQSDDTEMDMVTEDHEKP